MKVLIIGGGGREHALAWKAAQSHRVDSVFVAPGNAGTALEPGVENVAIAAEDINGLVAFAQAAQIDLTIVGPEGPLVGGVVDRFMQQGLHCFGPIAQAAQLEGSKAFAKDFLARHSIPTANHRSFTEVNLAKAYVEEAGTPCVIKADGLAAGKGVIIAESQPQAFAAIEEMLAGNRFGEAGHRVVIEEFLTGEEASFICIVDGETILPLASSQDHKARDNGDTGPNTGGMGAYSPAPIIDETMHEKIMQKVMRPTVKGLRQDGINYTGFLYAGLMIDSQSNVRVLEFNCRLGDPETQPILMRLQSDLVELCHEAVTGELTEKPILWDQRVALGVVMAAGGYPDSYAKDRKISGLDINNQQAKIFHAGTTLRSGEVLTSGGRVLCITALGETVTQAQHNAYQQVNKVSWDQAYYRTDIGHRAITRESQV